MFAFAVSWIWIIFGMILKTSSETSRPRVRPVSATAATWAERAQVFVRINPVSHLTSATRGLMHGTDVGADIVWTLAASAVIVGISAPIAMGMYRQER